MIGAVASIEGYTDAINMYDKGLISLGVQQWTLHHDNELDVLLMLFQRAHPDDYDAHFGVDGLGLKFEIGPDGPPRLALELERGCKPGRVAVGKIEGDKNALAGVHRRSQPSEHHASAARRVRWLAV